MNARTIRRTIQRKAEKQTRKEAIKSGTVAAPRSLTPASDQLAAELQLIATELEAHKASLAQLKANRRNAMLSTGPASPEGKAISSATPSKPASPERRLLLPSEDATLYESHIQGSSMKLNPAGDRERALVRSIADAKWRLARIPSLEFGIYALGRLQFTEEFQNHPQAEAAALIEAKTFLTYQRQLNNLSIQESRLRRQCEKDAAELTRLQQQRAAATRKTAPPPPSPKTQPGIGFELSNSSLDLLEAGLDLDSDLLTRCHAIQKAA